MTRDILLTAGVVLAAAFGGGIGWWVADRRGRTRLADLRTIAHARTKAAWAAYDTANGLAGEFEALALDLRKELEAMTDAHHRGQYEYERLLEIHRAVPEAFRAPLGHLDADRAPAVLLYDAWPVPSMDGVTADAAHLASILGEKTDVWSRVVYRTPGAARTATVDTGTVHEGELLYPVGQALVPVKSYPAPKQRHGKGKRR
jgi:hypothetical protein